MSAHRAERRRAARALAKHVETLGEEAGGAYSLQVFFPETILPTILEAREPQQIHALICFNHFLCQLGQLDASSGPMCLTCNTVFHGSDTPRAIAVVLPLRDDATVGLCFGLCWGCCDRFGMGQGLRKAILDKLRSSFISDLREIPTPSSAGRA